MRTDELLDFLSNDNVEVKPMPSFSIAMLWGLAASVLALFLVPTVTSFGIRPGYFEALTQGSVAFKQLLPLGLALLLLPVARVMIYPETDLNTSIIKRIWPYLLAAICLFGIGFIGEGHETRSMAIRGKSAPYCLTLVPVFAMPIYFSIMSYVRKGAPANAMRAGLWAGLFAGAVGCFVYAFTCVDDNPMFWTWAYSSGIAISGAMGAVIGKFALRW